MRGTKAKRLRREREAQGLSPFAEPQHNTTDREDTRADRRKKKFKPKAYKVELDASSPRKRMAFVNKWNRIYYSLIQHSKTAKDLQREDAQALAEIERLEKEGAA